MTLTCEMCRYWKRVSARLGECRRNPPRSKPRDLDHGDELAWVITAHTDWCGECYTHTGDSLREDEKRPPNTLGSDGAHRKSPLITERDACVYLGVSRSFLAQARMHGTLGDHTPGPPFVRIGRTIRYNLRDLDEWIEKHGYRG